MNVVATALIESIDWASLRTASGVGDGLPSAFNSVIEATSEVEAKAAYWSIDNEVLVQGESYESALPALEVLLAMLPDVVLGPVRKCIAELIQQIVFSQPHSSEIERGNDRISERCVTLAKEATWVFYGWLSDSDQDVRECALLTLHKLEGGEARAVEVFNRYRVVDKSSGIQKIFSQMDKGLL
ncbi:hypothetical protein [Amycolatopsis japonica]|uniref:hypothetical protein n=1 Tax=Amycolatopsis japonica TaxID=208439 RepID=UPI0011DD2C9D|nr:hypothetical protein [Amycolatopsis japonica]